MIRHALAVLPLLLLVFAPGAARAEQVSAAEVDRFAQPLVEGEWCRGLVIGVLDEQGPRVFGYGKTSDANAAAPNGETIFEIGSVTKAFTGVLLAEMAARGEVALDDPLRKYLPDSVKVPQIGEQPITLAHLASHTSGLPRLPSNLKPADPANPYADYTVEQMYAFLADCKPARPPGARYEYSNLGMGLLGHVLALRAGKSYEDVLTERVLKPLGMSDTRITLDEETRTARLAPGYDADGEPLANWDIPTLAGAGALRSTANDMLKFIGAAVDLAAAPAPLRDAMKSSYMPRAAAMPGNQMGLGWHVGSSGGLVWHNGQTGGYHAYCAFVPERKVGLVVLANTGTGLVDAIGAAMIKRLLGQEAEPLPLRKPVVLPPEKLDQLTGRYILTPFFAITVTREGERLYAQATNQPRFRIYPESETACFYKIVDAQLRFKLNKGGRAFMLMLHQNGLKLPGIRAETPTTVPTFDD